MQPNSSHSVKAGNFALGFKYNWRKIEAQDRNGWIKVVCVIYVPQTATSKVK